MSVMSSASAITSSSAAVPNDLLINAPYYHGFQTRVEADALLPNKNGTFLVRLVQEQETGEFIYIISVFWKGKKRHYRIYQTEHCNYYYLNQVPKRTVTQLIRFHRFTQTPVHHQYRARLRQFVPCNHFALYREQLSLKGTVGHGEFGEVCKGKLRLGIWTQVDVAVKRDTQGMNADHRIQFLREANLMMRLRHRNIVRLFGVVVYDDPILIVTEYAAGGCLLPRLMSQEQPTKQEKKRFCRDICSGMAYLESKLVIHRDLAVKNCLLGQNDTVKIADFGLSIWGRSSFVNRGGRAPIRYIPPETLKRAAFSFKSDVWAYGCTLFEIWKYPYEEPYQEIQDNYALRKRILYEGLRLEPPEEMPARLKKLMGLCHSTNPDDRPTFAQIKEKYFYKEQFTFREQITEFFNTIQRALLF